jgi:hypothetical protein
MISPEPRKAFLQQLEHRRQTLAESPAEPGGGGS